MPPCHGHPGHALVPCPCAMAILAMPLTGKMPVAHLCVFAGTAGGAKGFRFPMIPLPPSARFFPKLRA